MKIRNQICLISLSAIVIGGVSHKAALAAPGDGATTPTTIPSPASMPAMTGDMSGMTMPMEKPTTAPTTAPIAYHARGQVVRTSTGNDGRGAAMVVDHENIRDFMNAMRMKFALADPADASMLHTGDKIAFDLIEDTSGGYAATHIQMLPADTKLKLAGGKTDAATQP